jgi:hypothetical protein
VEKFPRVLFNMEHVYRTLRDHKDIYLNLGRKYGVKGEPPHFEVGVANVLQPQEFGVYGSGNAGFRPLYIASKIEMFRSVLSSAQSNFLHAK